MGKLVYNKIFQIHDTPQKICVGFGLGVFTWIMPGTWIIAALFLAFLFRVNRAAALAGSLLTNTWLSLVTFLLSIKVGSAIMGLDWRQTYQTCSALIKHFQIRVLLEKAFFKVFLTLLIGYAVVAMIAASLAYLVAIILFKRGKANASKNRT